MRVASRNQFWQIDATAVNAKIWQAVAKEVKPSGPAHVSI